MPSSSDYGRVVVTAVGNVVGAVGGAVVVEAAGTLVAEPGGAAAIVVSVVVPAIVVSGITPGAADESFRNTDGKQAPVAGGANPNALATAAANTERPILER